MITFETGDVLEADSEALVNTVNCVGVMGRGVALRFKTRFPDNFTAYAAACKRGEVVPGRMFVFEPHALGAPRLIINFPTKRHWRGKSRMDDIDSGLRALVREIGERGIRSIAIPPLGSGLGGLHWLDVRPRIEAALAGVDGLEARVFEPSGAPETHASRPVPAMTPGRAALVALVRRYLAGCMDPFVTLLELHKLLYFMQEAGEPLRLTYARGPYGPFAENLRHVLNAVEGHLVTGYAGGGDAPGKRLELVPGAIEDAERYLAERTETQARFARVDALVDGFETPSALELLSTVHWVVSRDGVRDPAGIVAAVHAWSERKRRFTPRQIAIAFDALDGDGWLSATAASAAEAHRPEV